MSLVKIFAVNRVLVVACATAALSGCQATTQSAPEPTVIVFEGPTVVSPEVKPVEALSILRVADGSGCPNRDPATYGVFLKSERDGAQIICYYN
jgi:hypothetical protein